MTAAGDYATAAVWLGERDPVIARLIELTGLPEVAPPTVDLDPAHLADQTDEEIVRRLSTVRGIGKWSAEMFLMFQLLRLDVWPTGDLAVRKGYALAWNVEIPTPEQLDVVGEAVRPYRGVAAWYCWAALRSVTCTSFSPSVP